MTSTTHAISIRSVRFIRMTHSAFGMSTEFAREPTQHDGDDDPHVPVEVLEAIENLAEGNTASKEEIETVLKF